jgi:opacity protein-like surface antigen
MIRKFAMALVLTALAGAALHAQQAPPPTPDPQQPAGQESQEQESTSRRKVRPHNYRNWTFNVDAGGNLPNGTTQTFVKGGGINAGAGAARNLSKYFGLRLDFMWIDLPLRTSALQAAQAPGGRDYVYSLMLDPIINIPVTKKYGGYLVFGPGYLRRSGKLDSSTAIPGSACNPFWNWWGTCSNISLPLTKDFLSTAQNEFGYNFGGGITRKVGDRLEIYGEFRYLHGKHNNITTDTRPISIGVRW